MGVVTASCKSTLITRSGVFVNPLWSSALRRFMTNPAFEDTPYYIVWSALSIGGCLMPNGNHCGWLTQTACCLRTQRSPPSVQILDKAGVRTSITHDRTITYCT